VLPHDPSFAATGHIEAGHFASPFDGRGFGADLHLV
jgi:hypothetical protein